MSVLSRLRELPPELRNAGIAAAAMVVTLLLPWYQQSYVPEGSREFVQRNVSAFGAFSFVEAAVMLVAAGVLFLVWARSEKKGFHLPGGDGTAIAMAGGWAVLLIVWRLFDEPDATSESTDYSLQWGIFAGLAAAAAAPPRRPQRRHRGARRAAGLVGRAAGGAGAGAAGPAAGRGADASNAGRPVVLNVNRCWVGSWPRGEIRDA